MGIALNTLRMVNGRVIEVPAEISEGRWYCLDNAFLKVLRAVRLPPGYYPNRDLAMADYVARAYGGHVENNNPKLPREKDLIY